MPKPVSGNTTATKTRLARHRSRLEQRGLRRMEISVPAEDAIRLSRLARILRNAGDEAKRVRSVLDGAFSVEAITSGDELWSRLVETAPADINPFLEPRRLEPERRNPFE